MSQQSQTREVAHRVFATELNDAIHTFKESAEERAPVYALLPTGERANRIFFAGTLTETEDVGDEDEYWQGRITDTVGTIFVYAGQYQPEAAGMLREIEPPAYVSVVGKPRTYETDDGDVNVSVRPENISVVSEDTRDRWMTETAKRTLSRIKRFNTDEPNEYVQMAKEQYGDSVGPYREDVVRAMESLEE
ncbi:hypothetical protein HLRTI_000462 [Halorhabdus tiamatea SARL4B]|uniref:Uncharacterized protein n=1 Tax=Halorhabdus tiamatea SARL4B TaxID=1033806 RepID=F7PLN1_9EURY|nr:hypothetical protein [Halorhabdus tiamatea]ERJ07420.1 hypothetical protein HLRTI_000462 [Halorhabdus tiamatea SARL4B]